MTETHLSPPADFEGVDAATLQRLPRGAAFTDTAVIVQRNLKRLVRTPQLLFFATVQPVMFVLLFNYVFGNAIRVPGARYVDYLLPGVFVQTVAFGGINTAIGLSADLSTGIIDRFRSLPMARSAVLAGRTLADAVRNLAVIALMPSGPWWVSASTTASCLRRHRWSWRCCSGSRWRGSLPTSVSACERPRARSWPDSC
jgi:hypothetical protein